MSNELATLSTNSGNVAALGRTEARLWTPPLRELTPETSYGYDVIEFAREVLQQPLDPWQEWAVIHAGELMEDGRPRFRTVLMLVARQQGKTHLLKVLSLYWLYIERQKLILGMSTNLDYAREAWRAAVDLAQANPYLSEETGRVRMANGEQELQTLDGCRYKIAASNRSGGRSMTVNRLIIDELREHKTWEAWNASTPTTNAVPTAQIFLISNQGDDESIVLDSLRNSALNHLETGDGDPRLGIFEWSMPDGSEVDDLEALAYANPNLGRRTDADTLLGAAKRAKHAGGQELAGFKTEIGCIRVHQLDPAIDPTAWLLAMADAPIDMADQDDRRYVALGLDVSLDGSHASLVAACLVDGLVHVEVVSAWQGHGCTAQLRRQLPEIVAKVRPRVVGWLPSGPAASVAAALSERRGWPPRGVGLDAIRADVGAVCMGLAEIVGAGELRHPGDPLLNKHVSQSTRYARGDQWVFARRDASAIDATYALAVAVHLARTLPPPLPSLTVL